MTDFDRWIGRRRVAHDVIDAWHVAAFRGTLDLPGDLPEEGMPLPACWHWLFFRPHYRASDSGPDGHERLGAFLPALAFPRRMWAGGRIDFLRPPQVGERLTRTSVVSAVTPKHGRSGEMAFVTVSHRIEGDRGGRIDEEQVLVYRGPADVVSASDPPAGPVPAARSADWEHRWEPDPLLLFRYSALTFNSHRIHYDRRYCLEEEGYPGLVVHGPLMATLLANLAEENGAAPVRRFEYRSRRPVFDTMSFRTRGRETRDGAELWVERPDGSVAVEATVEAG